MKRLMIGVALAAVLICWPIACVRGHLSKVKGRDHYMQLRSGDATMTPVSLVVDGTNYGPGFTIINPAFLARFNLRLPSANGWGRMRYVNSHFGRLHFADGTSIGVNLNVCGGEDTLVSDIYDPPQYIDMMDWLILSVPDPVDPKIHAIFEQLRHPPSFAASR